MPVIPFPVWAKREENGLTISEVRWVGKVKWNSGVKRSGGGRRKVRRPFGRK